MPPGLAPESIKMSDSPLLKGAKALRPWGLSCGHLGALAHGITPGSLRLLSHLRWIFVGGGSNE